MKDHKSLPVCVAVECLGNIHPLWYRAIICRHSDNQYLWWFCHCPLTCCTFKLHNTYWWERFLEGEQLATSVDGNITKARGLWRRYDVYQLQIFIAPTVLLKPLLDASRIITKNEKKKQNMGLCVGSTQVSVNIFFSQTHCHKQKKDINQLRHRHRQSCVFHQSRKQKRENICTLVQL